MWRDKQRIEEVREGFELGRKDQEHIRTIQQPRGLNDLPLWSSLSIFYIKLYFIFFCLFPFMSIFFFIYIFAFSFFPFCLSVYLGFIFGFLLTFYLIFFYSLLLSPSSWCLYWQLLKTLVISSSSCNMSIYITSSWSISRLILWWILLAFLFNLFIYSLYMTVNMAVHHYILVTLVSSNYSSLIFSTCASIASRLVTLIHVFIPA